TRVCALALVFLLCGAVVFMATPAKQVEAVTCASGAAAQNGITVTPSHGTVFYIDTGTTPKLDAGYIGYQIRNGTGTTTPHLWAEVRDFSGGVLSLANADDAYMQLSSLANNATGTAYFLLKGTSATTNAQSHTLRVYDDRPDLANAHLLYDCSFSFSQV